MGQAGIAACLGNLLRRQAAAVDQTLGIALPQRDVACRVFIEQRIVKQHAAFRDGRGVRHKGNLANAPRALIGIQEVHKSGLALVGFRLDDLSGLKTHLDILDHASLVGQRLRGARHTLDFARMRGRENLFGRDIRHAAHALLRHTRATGPEVRIRQADSQIGAVATKVNGVETLIVQPVAARLKGCVMFGPGGNRVRQINARGREDRFGQFFLGFVRIKIGEHQRRPGAAGVGHDRPVGIETRDPLHGGLRGLRRGFDDAPHIGRVFARQQHRVVARDAHPRGVVAESIGHALEQPVGRCVPGVIRAMAIARKRDLFIIEQRRDDAGTRGVGLPRDPAHQRQGFD